MEGLGCEVGNVAFVASTEARQTAAIMLRHLLLVSLLNGVEEVVQGHENTIVESVSVLGRVKKSVVVPYQVYAFSNSSGPHF